MTPLHNIKHVNIKLNTGKLRDLRDLIDNHGGVVKVRDLKKKGFDLGVLRVQHLVDAKGNLHANDIQKHIETLPALNYDIGHSTWESSEQNHNPQEPNHVYQLNITPEQEKKLTDEGVMDAFRQLHRSSFESGHPVDHNTAAWIRYSHSPKDNNVHIDEIQSDLGPALEHKLKLFADPNYSPVELPPNASENDKQLANQWSQMSPGDQDNFRYHMSKVLLPKIEKINKILFNHVHPNKIVHEGFLQTLRDKGLAGSRIQVWRPEAKAPLAGLQSGSEVPSEIKETYADIPKSMGYKESHEIEDVQGNKIQEPIHYGELESQSNDTHNDKRVMEHKLKKSMEISSKLNISGLLNFFFTVVPSAKRCLNRMKYLQSELGESNAN